MKRRTVLAGTSALLMAATRIAAGATTVRVGVAPTDASSEAYYAVERGFFTQSGVDAGVVQLTSGGAIATAVASGTLDIGIANPVALATAVAHGVPFVIVAAGAVYDTAEPATMLCVARESPIAKAKDFEGAAIACPTLREIGELVTVAYLQRNGADPTKVQIVEMPIPAMGAALKRGTIAGALISEPSLAVAVDAGDVRPFAKVYDVVASRFYNSVWFATRGWYAANAAAANGFARAIYDAARWANQRENRDTSGSILAKYAKISPEITRRMTRARFDTSLQAGLLDPLLVTAARGNLTSRRVTVAELVAS